MISNIQNILNLKTMERTKLHLQEIAHKLNTLLGLNPPIDINLDRVKLEVEICKHIYEAMSSIAGDKLYEVMLDLVVSGPLHSPDEN